MFKVTHMMIYKREETIAPSPRNLGRWLVRIHQMNQIGCICKVFRQFPAGCIGCVVKSLPFDQVKQTQPFVIVVKPAVEDPIDLPLFFFFFSFLNSVFFVYWGLPHVRHYVQYLYSMCSIFGYISVLFNGFSGRAGSRVPSGGWWGYG